jgi:hypothetical protein
MTEEQLVLDLQRDRVDPLAKPTRTWNWGPDRTGSIRTRKGAKGS